MALVNETYDGYQLEADVYSYITALDSDVQQPLIQQPLYIESSERSFLRSNPTRHNNVPFSVAPQNVTARGFRQTAYSKVWSYSNARLPPHLPPLKLFFPTYPLLCLASRHSLTVYSSSSEREGSAVHQNQIAGSNITSDGPTKSTTVHIPPSSSLGTRAMSLSLAPCICSNTPTLVVAIRGTANFADWTVNFRSAPTSPENFLDDKGNLVHAGFLGVARAMVEPMMHNILQYLHTSSAAGSSGSGGGSRRRQPQLLLTGHSAGGALASLLFCHVLSSSYEVQSPLKDLVRSAFKRVHCITFGAPPVTLLPLTRPDSLAGSDARSEAKSLRKNLFFSFLNEGDPVARADPIFLRSLLELYARPTPSHPVPWSIPQIKYSLGGKIVVLRPKKNRDLQESAKGFFGLKKTKKKECHSGGDSQDYSGVEAIVASDELLRQVVYGDPSMHSMTLYKERIEGLAVKALIGES